ncbi:MAG TPA: prepilin peptidase [Candidatus Paceibacterota bacterium]
MIDVLPAFFFFFVGIAAGSFVNVAVLRFGFTERPNPRSECPHCGALISWHDLVPVFSYLALSGRCRFCGSRLTLQYPLVEFGLGALFALSYVFYPPSLIPLSLIAFFALLLFWAAFVAIVAYDIRHTLIPLSFVAILSAAAITRRLAEAAFLGSVSPLLDAALGALLLGGFFFLVFLVTRGKGMGIGDSYVGAGMGILLGLERGIDAALLGMWIGTLVSLILLSSRVALFNGGRRVNMKTELPFAPWLFLGTALALFTDWSALGVAEWLTNLFI